MHVRCSNRVSCSIVLYGIEIERVYTGRMRRPEGCRGLARAGSARLPSGPSSPPAPAHLQPSTVLSTSWIIALHAV